jgi:hypothetical protein
MTAAALLLLLFSGPDPCRDDTSSWNRIRHGPEEISHRRDGEYVYLALRNRGSRPVQVDVVWRELNLSGALRVFNIDAARDEGKVQAGFARKLDPGACAAYRVRIP